MASALHLQLHQFGCKTFMHFCAMNFDVEIAPLKNCAEIALLYLSAICSTSLSLGTAVAEQEHTTT